MVTSEQDRGYFFTGDAVTITILGVSAPPTASAQTRADIRQVDFKNFSYRLEGKLAQLKNGGRPARNDNEYTVSEAKVSYGDLTGDGQEEAIIILGYDGGGTGSFTFGYLYSMQNGRPVLLTTLKGGDRADGGIVSAKIVNSLLVIERNVPERENGIAVGLCCPKYVETVRYKWDGARLVRANQAAQTASPNQPKQSLGQALKSGIRDVFTGNKTDQPLSGTEVKMTAGLKKTLNTFFSNFSETNLEPFEAGRIRDDALIQFGVLHNVINNPKLFEIVGGGENQRLAAKHVEAAVEKYFGLRIGQHKSLAGNYSYIKYRNGFYYAPRASGEAYTFSQVMRLIDNNGTFTAYVNVYVASSGSNINPHGTPAEWKRAGQDPQLSTRMKAAITTVGEGGRSRYVLLSYSTP